MKYLVVWLGLVLCFIKAEPLFAQAMEEGVTQIQPQPLTQAQPTPDSTSTFMSKLESSLINELSGQGIDGNLRIELIGEQEEILRSLYYGDADIQKVQITNVNANNGYFSALAEISPHSLGRNIAVQLQGQYEDVVYIPVVKAKVLKGNVITQRDVTMMQRDSRLIKGDVISHPEDIIGKMAKRNIMPGKPISARVVSEPVLVKKGAHVTIVYSTPTIRLRTVGVALEDGEHGALIPVKNITSGVVIHAEVQGKNEVVVPSVVGEEEQADDDEYDNNDHQNYY